MKKITITCLLVLISLQGYSQIDLQLKIGYSSSSHQDLIDFQRESVALTPLPIQTVNNFDPSVHWILSGTRKIKQHNVGLYFLYKKTGARSGIIDITGLYRLDQEITLNTIGIEYKYALDENFYVGSRIGYTSSRNQLNEEFLLFNEVVLSEQFLLKANGFEINPNVEYRRNIMPWLDATIELGYNIDASKKLKLSGQETTLKPNWSGYRISLGVVIDPSLL